MLAAPPPAAVSWAELCQERISRGGGRLISSSYSLWEVSRYFLRHSDAGKLRLFLREVAVLLDEVTDIGLKTIEVAADLAQEHSLSLRCATQSAVVKSVSAQLISPDDSYDVVPGIVRLQP